MQNIRYRQAIFSKTGQFLFWHYWGFTRDGVFVGPELNSSTHEQALKRSEIFTGKQDRNGADIYEGDILALKDIRGKIIEQGVVEWSEVFLVLSWSTRLTMYSAGNTEIIGNITENPELKDIVIEVK